MAKITCEQCTKSKVKMGLKHDLYCRSLRHTVERDRLNEVNGDLHGIIDGVQYCRFGSWTTKAKIRLEKDEPKQVECHSEYSRDLIKNCRFGSWRTTPRGRKMWCRCTRDCAECVVGKGDNGMVPMKPDLYYARQEERRGMCITSGEQRGLIQVLKDKQERKDAKERK
jgi:hypothetical protein